MKHNQISQGLIGDLIEPAVMGATQAGAPTARFKIAFAEVKKDQNGNNQFFKSVWLATAFNEAAHAISRIPPMSTIMFAAKLDRYKAQDKDEWMTRLVLFNVAVVGPSDFVQFYQQQNQGNANGNGYANQGYAPEYDPYNNGGIPQQQFAQQQQRAPQQHAPQPHAPQGQQFAPPPVQQPQFPGFQGAQAPFNPAAQQQAPVQHQPAAPMYPGAPQPAQAQPYRGQMPPPNVAGRNPLDDIPF